MHRRRVRLTFVSLLAATLVAAAYMCLMLERRTTTARSASDELDRTLQQLNTLLDDTRVAWLSALVPGQGVAYWMPRASSALETSATVASALRQRSTTADATNALDAAVSGIGELIVFHRRIAGQLARDERTVAAKDVFALGFDALTDARQQVETARTSERAAVAAVVTTARTQQALAAAAAALAGLLGTLLMAFAGRRSPEAAAEAGDAVVSLADARHALTHEPTVTSSSSATVVARPAAAASVDVAEPASPTSAETTAPQTDRRRLPELRAAADLCTDYARLVDAQELPGLLERSAHVLDASGLVVWLIDRDGGHLRASLVHGYPDDALQRMPAIPRQADNATAAAFRSHDVQVVRTNGMSNGALVVPLVAPQGCIGVITAEVRHGREGSEMMRQVARLVAAQLSTLVAPVHAAQMQAPTRDAIAR